jgi:DNA-binding LytR/AlgR family response regulator
MASPFCRLASLYRYKKNAMQASGENTQPFFFIRSDGRYIKISFADILYLESVKNYVRIVTVQKNWLVLMSLRHIEQELPADMFCRVHRSYVVSLYHIVSFDNEMAQLENKQIPIGNRFRQALPARVKILNGDLRSRSLYAHLDAEGVLNGNFCTT